MLQLAHHDAPGLNIEVLQEAERKLAQCQDLSEVIDIRDEVEAFRAYAKARRLSLEIQNRAAKLKIQAERKIGSALGALKLRGGDRKSNSQPESLILQEMGIGRNDSSRWQKEAAAPEDVFQSYCMARLECRQEISTGNFLSFLSCRARKPRKRRTPAGSKRGSETTTAIPQIVVDDLDEILGHVDTLARMFADISGRLGKQLNRVERREIPRYLERIRTLVRGIDPA